MRSTNAASIRATSFLKASTSCQQSNGRRSFNRRQPMTLDWALATPSSSSASFLRPSRRVRSASISVFTVSREMLRLSGCWVVSAGTAAGAAVSYSRPAKGMRGASRFNEPTGYPVLEGATGPVAAVTGREPVSLTSARRFSISARVCCSRSRRRWSSWETRF